MEEKKISFEEIQKANETIKTTDIKGKDYAEVNQRIKAYRMVYPNGTIKPEIKSLKDGVCIFRAEVTNDNGDVIGVGHAYEKENSTFINKTSYIENCETSAVGRALGMAGFGIDTSVASAEEIQNAIENQKEDKKVILATENQIKMIKDMMSDEQINEACKLVKKENLNEFTIQEASSLIKKLKGGN
ncbi:MAG TPA: hypothetical protein IAB27_03800 [Candidatus Coprosoma intestinipullorum]|uniref:Uncharacterized protein n=1 Tax=Candidatus Coprosoma intestinipullorum TaxID=2840752 RepID=A0A9D0ZQE7_9FIRM|nr:hypothetical protein [Candidatus Coprosoma intestinipullorum]